MSELETRPIPKGKKVKCDGWVYEGIGRECYRDAVCYLEKPNLAKTEWVPMCGAHRAGWKRSLATRARWDAESEERDRREKEANRKARELSALLGEEVGTDYMPGIRGLGHYSTEQFVLSESSLRRIAKRLKGELNQCIRAKRLGS